MSRRFVKVTVTTVVIAVLLVATYYINTLWSGHPRVPTAGKILFLSDRSGPPGHYHVWLGLPDGSDLTELTRGDETDADPAFSPDGSQIAYVSDKSGEQQVYVMDADGKSSAPHTVGSDSKSSPEFSPDGSHVAYIARGVVNEVNLIDNSSEQLFPNAVGASSDTNSDISQVEKLPVVAFGYSPVANAATHEAAFAVIQEDPTGTTQVVSVVPKPGDNAKTLGLGLATSFAWSPDGSTLSIAVLGYQGVPGGAKVSGIVQFAADGTPSPGSKPLLVPDPSSGPQNPSCSPDGETLAFEIWNEKDIASKQVIGIGVAPMDQSARPRMIAAGPATNPHWDPSGTPRLLFTSPTKSDGSKHDIVVINSDGTSPLVMTKGVGDNISASWSPALPKSG